MVWRFPDAARIGLALALGLAASLAGCAARPAPATGHGGCANWACRDVTQTHPRWYNKTLSGHTGIEATYRLAAGAHLSWDWFMADQSSLYFDVHTHLEDGSVANLKVTTAASDQADFAVNRTSDYSLFWANHSDRPETLWFRIPEEGVQVQMGRVD